MNKCNIFDSFVYSLYLALGLVWRTDDDFGHSYVEILKIEKHSQMFKHHCIYVASE